MKNLTAQQNNGTMSQLNADREPACTAPITSSLHWKNDKTNNTVPYRIMKYSFIYVFQDKYCQNICNISFPEYRGTEITAMGLPYSHLCLWAGGLEVRSGMI